MEKIWNTLIVDDETLARERLICLLSFHPQYFKIIGEAVDSVDARNKIEFLNPDIVFLDIEMPGGNIFEVLKVLEHKPFIIFCTAFDNYALQAFQTNSIDYLIKPVEQDNLENVIQKLRKITSHAQKIDYIELESLIKKYTTGSKPSSIPYKVGDKTIYIKLSQTVYFQSSEKYVEFFDFENKRYLTDLSLKELEIKLKTDFIRISKSTILNKEHVKEIHRYFRSKFVIHMNDIKNTKLVTGSNYYDTIKETFEL
jgi:two-component system LytT family response regulator